MAGPAMHGDRPEINALTLVRELSNTDKHRALLDAVTVPAEPNAEHFTVDAHDVDDIKIDANWGVPLAPGMTAASVRFMPTGPNPRCRVHAHAPSDASFGAIGFRAVAMPPVLAGVAGVLGQFNRYFT